MRESCLYVVKAQSFLIRLESKLLLSDARAYSNRTLKQCIVMTLRYFPTNLQYVISITSIENAITFVAIDVSLRKHFCRMFSLLLDGIIGPAL